MVSPATGAGSLNEAVQLRPVAACQAQGGKC